MQSLYNAVSARREETSDFPLSVTDSTDTTPTADADGVTTTIASRLYSVEGVRPLLDASAAQVQPVTAMRTYQGEMFFLPLSGWAT